MSVTSTVNRIENPTNGNVKTLAAEDESCHVLGLEWNYRFGTLVVNRGTNSDHYRTLTQRIELNLVSAVYDPIGLVAPYTVKTQLLLKDVWQLSGQYWDDHLPDHIVDKFVEWIDELTKLTEITFLRSNFDGQAEQVELHLFGNISRDVFSSVAFLRVKMTIGSRSRTELAFVFGESPSRANETLDNTQAGTTSSALSRSAKERNPISVYNTYRTNVYVDRHHYRHSVIAVHR